MSFIKVTTRTGIHCPECNAELTLQSGFFGSLVADKKTKELIETDAEVTPGCGHTFKCGRQSKPEKAS